MKVYIAGPMTGYVDHNFPAFEAAAKRLRALGYQVVNPAEMDLGLSHEELREIPHEVFMRRDIAALVECDGIYLLPGWTYSRGAALESTVARGCGLLEVHDPDVKIWRTFEGEPLDSAEDAEECDAIDHTYCEPVQGDGQGNTWCSHGESVSIARPDATADGYDWPPLRVVEEPAMDVADVIVLHTTRPTAEVPLSYRGHSTPEPGDGFPNVAYVRDMTGRTAAELAEVARAAFESEQFVRGTE